ncbi:hypothetical protein EJ02DRAFT_48130 [Clathrospora elynae]|uniref:Myb-like DNA-binding domain-containing protein n=1 Tax=Clathrospora elynae TaxID=706981 RepID=A0A6A5SAR8_9PLEO|nr:hypothetical protein EJ02DRAFT_48130 [Clathrospora elynae]
MLTEAENVQYLYLILTNNGNPTIDWQAVGAALGLNKGAASKRWSRLKLSMDKGEGSGGATYQFLWLCVKHNNNDQVPNWAEIAAKSNTTTGAASKRYSRIKQAIDAGADAPAASTTSPVKPKAMPKKKKATTSSGDDVPATLNPKRKRASPRKKPVVASDEVEMEGRSKPETENDEEMPDVKSKRVKATSRCETKAAVIKKEQPAGEGAHDPFYDAHGKRGVNGKQHAGDENERNNGLHNWLCTSG